MFSPNSTTSPLVCDFLFLSPKWNLFFESFHKMSCSRSLSSLVHRSRWRRWLHILTSVWLACEKIRKTSSLFFRNVFAAFIERVCEVSECKKALNILWNSRQIWMLHTRASSCVCLYMLCMHQTRKQQKLIVSHFPWIVNAVLLFPSSPSPYWYQERRKKKKTSQRNTIITIN